MPKALITGVTGQDGAYLAYKLLGLGYDVWGTVRQGHPPSSTALDLFGITSKVHLLSVDFTNFQSLQNAVAVSLPDEIYNFAAQSSVALSFQEPLNTGEITGLGAVRLLQAIHEIQPNAKYFQASSSEIFGEASEVPQTESTPFSPRNPYGVAKVYAHWMTVNYREAYGLFACNGILFNHESPLRSERFVTRKICASVIKIKLGLQQELVLGNIDVERDWGFVGDYVEAIYQVLQQDTPNDYIISTGQTRSLREFIEHAFACVGLDYRDWVRIDPALYRPTEVGAVEGNASRAREVLGWKPQLSFEQLVEFLIGAEQERMLSKDQRVPLFPHELRNREALSNTSS